MEKPEVTYEEILAAKAMKVSETAVGQSETPAITSTQDEISRFVLLLSTSVQTSPRWVFGFLKGRSEP
eukprot:4476034-Amphidinium_carterae.1